MSGLVRIVSAMTKSTDKAHQFFERYAAALLARDEKAVARMYAVPSLILFPGTSIPVSDASQTEEFFAASWSQYDGFDAIVQIWQGMAPRQCDRPAGRQVNPPALYAD